MSEAVNEKLSKMASIYLETKFHVSGDAMLDMDHSIDGIPEDMRGSFYAADIMEGFARECVSAYIEAHKQTTLADDAEIARLQAQARAFGDSLVEVTKQNAALTDLLANIQECRKLGDFMLRKQINTALELYEEQTKGQ